MAKFAGVDSVDWPVLAIENRAIIRLAWGPRRVSSRAIAGTEAYPKKVRAHWRMWASWSLAGVMRRIRGEVRVVVNSDKEGHGERYWKELMEAATRAEADRRRREMEKRIPELQDMRVKARAERNFELADRIRGEIEAAGFKVSDDKISGMEGD